MSNKTELHIIDVDPDIDNAESYNELLKNKKISLNNVKRGDLVINKNIYRQSKKFFKII